MSVSETLPRNVSFQHGEARDLILEKRSSDPVLAEGKIWFRTDIDRISYSPDGSTVKRVPLSVDGIDVDKHQARHVAGGAWICRRWMLTCINNCSGYKLEVIV